MNSKADLLIEIGTEELPPKALDKLSQAFRQEVAKRFAQQNLDYREIDRYATPRRLALKILDLDVEQADQQIEKRGPAVKAAFDDTGEPTKAAMGFARSCGVEVAALTRIKTDKGEWLAYNADVKGEKTADLVPEIVSGALAALPIPKRMRWGSGEEEFVRPVHWVVLLLGTELIETTILGITADRCTFGHRFHAPTRIELKEANDYPSVLSDQGFVIPSLDERRATTQRLAENTAVKNACRAIVDPDLLDEVTALVEWPVPISGTFDEHFLDLPREVLIASMQDHQKYFPVETEQGVLTNQFITISNIESRDPKAVRQGNERVIRPRLSDAQFFWDQDRKSPLVAKLTHLENIIFEKRLGSLAEKTERVVTLTTEIGATFGANKELAARAASLSRADLVTEMVGEFPALQGIMGGYYAQHDQEPTEVSQALKEFYNPKFAGDKIPETEVGRTIAIADRLDTLVGIFAIGAAPTGDKDPYALRRAALGVLRILIETDTPLDLHAALSLAETQIQTKTTTTGLATTVFEFVMDRLRNYYADRDFSPQTIEAVLASGSTVPSDIDKRLHAVKRFSGFPESSDLAAANKRIANILKKSAESKSVNIDSARLIEPAEKTLGEALHETSKSGAALLKASQYTEYLSLLASLQAPINDFFDTVMVMSDDPDLRANRIALLDSIHQQFTQVADIGLLSD